MYGSGRISDETNRAARKTPETIYTIVRSIRMPTVIDIGTLIERSPEIRKGRPCIAGWYNLGLTPEEIAAKIEHPHAGANSRRSHLLPRQPGRDRQRHRG